MTKEIFRLRMQARAWASSIGQGSNRARYCKKPARTSMIALKVKTQALYSESQIIWGTVVTKPAIAAPIPKATNRLGKAQQKRVPEDANKESQEEMDFTTWGPYI